MKKFILSMAVVLLLCGLLAVNAFAFYNNCDFAGHQFSNGICIHCGASDPNYNPCANGHVYDHGYCIYCLHEDPNKDPCANGHDFVLGCCIHCYCVDPYYATEPTQAPIISTDNNPTSTFEIVSNDSTIRVEINGDSAVVAGNEDLYGTSKELMAVSDGFSMRTLFIIFAAFGAGCLVGGGVMFVWFVFIRRR